MKIMINSLKLLHY